MASALQEAYSDLFHTYSDACRRTDQELRDFFSTKTTAGAKAVGLTVTTFKNLCALADFTSSSQPLAVVPSSSAPATVDQGSIGVEAAASRVNSAGFTINLNIQIAVPETKDEDVYDKFFAALKKNSLT